MANLSQEFGRCGHWGFSCCMNKLFLSFLLAIGISLAMAQSSQNPSSEHATITLGAGCFWCVEAVFEAIPGVLSGESGYSGGHIKNPGTEVCTGRTGAEVVQLTYDVPSEFERHLESFLPRTIPQLNRQGGRRHPYWRDLLARPPQRGH